MDGWEIATTVLLDSANKPTVNLEEYVDVYSPFGEHVAELLAPFATVEVTPLDSLALSEFGTPLSSPLGDFVQAADFVVRIGPEGSNLIAAKSRDEIVRVFRDSEVR